MQRRLEVLGDRDQVVHERLRVGGEGLQARERGLRLVEEGREDADRLGEVVLLRCGGLEDLGGRTRMSVVSTFETQEQMEKIVAMGMEEGMKGALGQVDALLAEPVRA